MQDDRETKIDEMGKAWHTQAVSHVPARSMDQ